MASAKTVFKLRLETDRDAHAAVRQLLTHNQTPRALLGRHTVESFIEHYGASREDAEQAVRAGTLVALNITNPNAVSTVDMMELWNRGEDFLLNQCALVVHDNAIWFEVACPRFGAATLQWLRDSSPGTAWVNQHRPGALDHAAFHLAPAVACGEACILLAQAARLLCCVRDVGEPGVVLKTFMVGARPDFHCLMFASVPSADKMRLFACLGNRDCVGTRRDFRRSLHVIVTSQPEAAYAAVRALPDGEPYETFLQTVPGEGLCVIDMTPSVQ